MNGFTPAGGTFPLKVKIAEDYSNKFSLNNFYLQRGASSYSQLVSTAIGNYYYTTPGTAWPYQLLSSHTNSSGDNSLQAAYSGLLGGQTYYTQLPPNLWCLFVYNLPAQTDDTFLYNFFSPFGHVVSVKVVKDENQNCKGYGFVNMSDYQQAQAAIQALDGYRLGEKNLQVSFKQMK
ncbi:ELAV-like protein 2 [Zophobas morio]|uniref:ELAV-like protein 2 n=1 Tax=Zophobas morio TaxID=2755281 RepID=UPI003083357E